MSNLGIVSESLFLKDVLEGKIHFLQGPRHFETARAKIGENPEILGVLRLLVKAFQHEVQVVDEDGAIQKIIQNSTLAILPTTSLEERLKKWEKS